MNEYYISRENESEEDIEHYGVPGMKWGVRRYRNKDGSLTAKGKIKANVLSLRKIMPGMVLQTKQ